MRVAIHVRVSTAHRVQTQSIEQQLERLRSYVQAQGWDLPAETVFSDDGYSSATLKRPGLDQLRNRDCNHELDRLVLTAPDRLAGNYVHQMLLIEELAQGGCQVEVPDRPMIQDPSDRLLLQIHSAVAEYELTLIPSTRGADGSPSCGQVCCCLGPTPVRGGLHSERPRDPSRVRCDNAEADLVGERFASCLEPQSSVDNV